MGSLLFVFLSADEAATIHERVQAIAKNLELNWLMMFQGALGAWIPIYAVAAIALLFVTGRYMRVMWRLFRGESLIALWGEPYTLRGLSALK